MAELRGVADEEGLGEEEDEGDAEDEEAGDGEEVHDDGPRDGLGQHGAGLGGELVVHEDAVVRLDERDARVHKFQSVRRGERKGDCDVKHRSVGMEENRRDVTF